MCGLLYVETHRPISQISTFNIIYNWRIKAVKTYSHIYSVDHSYVFLSYWLIASIEKSTWLNSENSSSKQTNKQTKKLTTNCWDDEFKPEKKSTKAHN